MRRCTFLWLALGFLGLFSVAKGLLASAQLPAGNAGSGKPANLKVLPTETPLPEVTLRMKAMSRDLGVECSFCHEQDAETKRIDFASDANPIKDTAREMMRMTRDINDKYLSLLGDRRYAPPVTCGNCHLGQAHPPEFAGKEAR